jgi:hypothetical protein
MITGRGRTIAQLAADAELGDEAKAMLAPHMHPGAFVRLMVESGQAEDAVRFLAHALPNREAVWWAWVCARRAAGETPPPVIAASLDATERWIREPNDANRRAAMLHAHATPAGCAGLAAFFCGDNLGPANLPEPVPPGEFMAAKAITGAVLIAAVATEPERAPEKLQAFIEQGMEVVKRIKLWPEG